MWTEEINLTGSAHLMSHCLWATGSHPKAVKMMKGGVASTCSAPDSRSPDGHLDSEHEGDY